MDPLLIIKNKKHPLCHRALPVASSSLPMLSRPPPLAASLRPLWRPPPLAPIGPLWAGGCSRPRLVRAGGLVTEVRDKGGAEQSSLPEQSSLGHGLAYWLCHSEANSRPQPWPLARHEDELQSLQVRPKQASLLIYSIIASPSMSQSVNFPETSGRQQVRGKERLCVGES